MQKVNRPCFFYNTGGCYHTDGRIKQESECKYLHVKVGHPIEKPQHLKPPCKYFHLRGNCNNPYCIFGHSELSNARWQQYFPNHAYPGEYYTRTGNYSWDNEKKSETPENKMDLQQLKMTMLALLLLDVNR